MGKRPSWVPDHAAAECSKCGAAFSFDLRRHHCRNCGRIFCHACSSKQRPLLALGFTDPVRICDDCEKALCARDVFLEVAKKGDIDSVRAMLDQGMHPDSTTSLQTPILAAASRGHIPILALLLERGANVNGVPAHDVESELRKRADTPLHFAAIIGSVQCAKLLLESQADPNWQSFRFGETALHKSVVYGHSAVVQMLLEGGADPLIANDRGLTSLTLASLCGRSSVIAEFKRKGYEPPPVRSFWDVLLALHMYKRPKEARESFCTHLLALHAQEQLGVEEYFPFLCDLAVHESEDDQCLQRCLLRMAASSEPFGMEVALFLRAIMPQFPAARRFACALEDVLLSGKLIGEAALIDVDLPSLESKAPATPYSYPLTVDGIAPHKAPIRAAIVAATASSSGTLSTSGKIERSASNSSGQSSPIVTTPSSPSLTATATTASSPVVTPTNGNSAVATAIVSSLQDEQISPELKAVLFRSRKFLRLCSEIGTKLPLVPPQFRDRELRIAVSHMNLRLPTGLYMPILRSTLPRFAFLRVHPEESYTFHTKSRAPFLLCAEVEVMDATGKPIPEPAVVKGYKTPSKGNTTMLRAIFGEPWSDKKERIRKDSPHGSNPSWSLLSFIVKAGDDLRQEQFAMHLIHQFQAIFEGAKLPLWLRPYRVLVTGPDSGVIEAVPDAISIQTLRMRTPGFTNLSAYFQMCYGEVETKTHREAQKAFVESMAAYAVVCFLLQVKDRHDGNVLLDRAGHIVHIDFGFMLSNSPGGVNFERAPFKLTQELVDVMGGKKSEWYKMFVDLCVQGFLAARREHSRLLLLVELFASGLGSDLRLPCFQKGAVETLLQLRKGFLIGQTEEECAMHVHDLIEQSYENWTTRQYDNYQRWSKSIAEMFGW